MARGSQHCVGGSDQNHPKKKNCKKRKWMSEEALQIAEERSEKQRRKGKIYPTECRVPENSKDKKAS